MTALITKITDFLTTIGLVVRYEKIPKATFLKGLRIVDGQLVIDMEQLTHPGDILHEAGHLACMPPEIRLTMNDDLIPGDLHTGGEMMAIAWSYAACLHLAIDPAIVFHADGYRGGGQHILDNFNQGHYFGVPLLQWCGMTDSYPIMRSWTCLHRPD